MALFTGIIATLAAMAFVGYAAGRRVKNSEDFSIGGRKSTAVMVAGTILGSIVGGGGTVGTAQAAFARGIVGWWQTLGLGIGCLVLGVFLSNFIYRTRVETVPQVLMKTYGPAIGPITSLFGTIAIFFSIMSQLKSFIPLLTSMFPSVPLEAAAIIGIIMVFFYVVFGGILGTSLVGISKMVLIYISMLLCGGLAYHRAGGLAGLEAAFPPECFQLFRDGVAANGATGLSLMLGTLVTQIYIQGVLSAKDAKAARDGCLLSMALTLPLGLFGVAIGMYMKTAFPDIKAAEALPRFFLEHMHPLIAGVFIATLMITTLGSMAGLTLGVSTMMIRDLYKRVRGVVSDRESLLAMRVCIVVICCLCAYFSVAKAGTFIQTFVFLSFGMRTCVFLIPMLFAFFHKGKLTSAAGLASVVVGPLVNIYWNLGGKPWGLDPIYAGLIAGLLAFLIGNALSSTDYRDSLKEPEPEPAPDSPAA